MVRRCVHRDGHYACGRHCGTAGVAGSTRGVNNCTTPSSTHFTTFQMLWPAGHQHLLTNLQAETSAPGGPAHMCIESGDVA